MEKLYCQETRQAIRLVSLGVLRDVVISNIVLWEEQLLERCALPFLSSVDTEVDRVVRLKAVQTISTFASIASSSHLSDLIEILEKITKKIGDGSHSRLKLRSSKPFRDVNCRQLM